MSLEDFIGSLPNDSRAVLVASTGGHLAQLKRLASKFPQSISVKWITFNNSQSTSLLENESVSYIPYVGSRDYLGLFRALPWAAAAIRAHPADLYISTGAAIALLVLPYATLRGKRAIYIESVSRFDGPSLTGRLLARVAPGIEFYTQHQRWSNAKWRYSFTLLSDYHVGQNRVGACPRKVFVTLGTIKPYQCKSVVDRLLCILPEDAEIIWQLGATSPVEGIRGEVSRFMTAGQMQAAALWADVVVSHAGVGSALWLLDLGKSPVLVPRRALRKEHVDDHQEQIAAELATRGLATVREAPNLEFQDLVEAAGRQITQGHAWLGEHE